MSAANQMLTRNYERYIQEFDVEITNAFEKEGISKQDYTLKGTVQQPQYNWQNPIILHEINYTNPILDKTVTISLNDRLVFGYNLVCDHDRKQYIKHFIKLINRIKGPADLIHPRKRAMRKKSIQ